MALPSATNGRFVLPTPRQYSRQYAQVYFSRLMAQRAPLEAAANAAGWQSHAKKKRVVDLASAIESVNFRVRAPAECFAAVAPRQLQSPALVIRLAYNKTYDEEH